MGKGGIRTAAALFVAERATLVGFIQDLVGRAPRSSARAEVAGYTHEAHNSSKSREQTHEFISAGERLYRGALAIIVV